MGVIKIINSIANTIVEKRLILIWTININQGDVHVTHFNMQSQKITIRIVARPMDIKLEMIVKQNSHTSSIAFKRTKKAFQPPFSSYSTYFCPNGRPANNKWNVSSISKNAEHPSFLCDQPNHGNS